MRFQTVLFTIIFVVVGIALLVHGIPHLRLAGGHFSFSLFLSAVSVYAVWQISYAPYVSDYSRYLPADRTKYAFIYTYLGTNIGTFLPMFVGAAVAALYPALGTVAGVDKLLGSAFTMIVGISIIAPNAFNFYGGVITIITTASNVKEFRSTRKIRIVLSVLFGGLIYWGAVVGSGKFFTNLTNVLLLMLYFLIPWTAINLTDFYLIRRGRYRTEDFFLKNGPYGRWAWPGLVIYCIAFVVELPFMHTTLYEGPIAKAFGGADITWLVGVAVSVPLYFLLERHRLQKLPTQVADAVLEGAAASSPLDA